jgi:hypothetical protein
MNFQSAVSANLAEAVFRTVVHGVTNTVTSTATNAQALNLGEPVNLSTATVVGSVLGQEVIRPLTATNAVMNRLSVGPVASATIPLEGVGLVQVYGRAVVRLAEAATIAVGDILVANVNSAATNLYLPYGIGCWSAFAYATHTDLASVLQIAGRSGCSVIAMAPATAVSGTNSYTNGYAFIRAM